MTGDENLSGHGRARGDLRRVVRPETLGVRVRRRRQRARRQRQRTGTSGGTAHTSRHDRVPSF